MYPRHVAKVLMKQSVAAVASIAFAVGAADATTTFHRGGVRSEMKLLKLIE